MGMLGKIEEDLRESIKAKDEVKVRTLRMVKADIMVEKTRGTAELSEDKVLEIVIRASKKRKEAFEEFTKAGRGDLAEKEAQELHVIESYLPKQMSEDEVTAAIDAKMKEMGEIFKKDFGKIMGVIMKELKGQADGALVKKIITQKMEKL